MNDRDSIGSELIEMVVEVKKYGLAPVADLLEDALTKEEIEILIKILASRNSA